MSDEAGRRLPTRARAEREEAYRRYNEALSALDLARQGCPAWPEVPPLYDETQITPLNRAWNILSGEAPPTLQGWRGRLAGFIWRVTGPLFQRQLAFNAALVDHLNRNVRAHRAAHEALARALPDLQRAFEGLAHFELLLLHFLQQLTPLDDARERELREALEELRHVAAAAQRTALVALGAVEERLGGGQLPPPRSAAGGRIPSDRDEGAPPGAAAGEAREAGAGAWDERPRTDLVDGGALTSVEGSYLGFEDRFRGSEDEIRVRLAAYVPYFVGAADVLDLGCGRGELLDLLREAGIPARGIDLNPAMVDAARARGLDVRAADALAYVSALPAESLGGVAAIQVVEHLEPGYLVRLLRAIARVLRPGGQVVLETINPACWVAFFESYIRDLSHVRPIHPETLQYLLHATGFSPVEIVYRSPIPEAARLRRVRPRAVHFGRDEPADPLTELVTAFNENMERLNARLFAHQDYAAVAKKGLPSL